MNDERMLLNIIHSRKALNSLGKFLIILMMQLINYKYKIKRLI
jgi:hypothetical protein